MGLDRRSAPVAKGKRKRATLARWAWWLHGLAGLKLGLVIAVIMVTGTLAVFGHELDWMFGQHQRVVPKGEPAGLAQIHEAIRSAYPAHALIRVEAPRGPRSAASAIAVSPDRQFRRIYVDPYRLERVTNTDMLSARALLRQVHMSLLIPEYGRLFVSGLAILTTISMITGLIAYKRFWRGFLVIPRRRNWRTFLGDCHRLAGVWSIWFIAVIALTSLWYFYESLGSYGGHLDRPKLSAEAVDRAGAQANGSIDAAQALAAARHAVPQLDPQHLILPTWADEPIVVQGYSGAWLVRPRATAVSVNPYSGETVAVQRAQELGLKARLHEAADPLHFGTFGGIWTKLIWFVFGLAMSFLSISGLVIYAKRLAHRAAGRNRPERAGRGETKESAWDAGAT
jgi:uncharacterized iron-regulated membrane protein